MKVAFDIDSTLIKKGIDGRDVPRYDVIELYKWFQSHMWHMYIWSGGGTEYAKSWAEKLGLYDATIISKDEYHNIDISVDDEDVKLAKVNIKV